MVGMWIPGLGLELDGGIAQRTAFAFAGDLFLVSLLVLMGPWVLAPLMRFWTALLPSRGVAWHLAVQSCRTRAARSVAAVLPFALSLSFVGCATGRGHQRHHLDVLKDDTSDHAVRVHTRNGDIVIGKGEAP
ncbi:hypothetical protein ACFV0D_09365 [Streptomyces sp. NPDC059556]|uniref:hypothetical protein n=1 Tax=Streptomyces sp. NPDC059556 TaxID=3346863 RepID=UPI0036A258D4